MSLLFTKANSALSNEEYIIKYSLIYLGLRKAKDDSVEKIKTNEDNV